MTCADCSHRGRPIQSIRPHVACYWCDIWGAVCYEDEDCGMERKAC